MTRVVNVKKERCTVYIGRAMPGRYPPSKWGNPYRFRKKQDIWVVERRDRYAWSYVSAHESYNAAGREVLKLYKLHVLNRRELVTALPELVDQDLGCWCAPAPCHGNVLMHILAERGLICAEPVPVDLSIYPQVDLQIRLPLDAHALLGCPSCGGDPDVDCGCKRP